MFAKKSISRIFSCLLVFIFLFVGVLPVQAETVSRPMYTSGDFLWAKGIGGISDDWGNDIALDSAGNVYTTGTFQGTVDFDPGVGTANLTSAGDRDIFVSKFDNNGNFVWAKSMGGTGLDNVHRIALDLDGNVYTVGEFIGTADFNPDGSVENLTSTGSVDIFVSKLDNDGNFVWAKSIGGIKIDTGSSIALDNDGNVYITGWFEGTADFDPGVDEAILTSINKDAFISKLNSDGNFLWAKGMAGENFLSVSGAGDIALDSGNNVYITGSFLRTVDFDPGGGEFKLTSTNGSDDIFVSKLDSNGNFVWAKNMGGIRSEYSGGIALDSSGNVYTTGSFDSPTADFDPSVGGTANLTSAGGADIFVSKLKGNGDFVWAKSMGGIGTEYGTSIALDTNGNIYTTGQYDNTVDFDPDAGTTANLACLGGTDAFVSKLDSNGNFVWAKRMGGSGADWTSDVALDSSGNIFTTGSFEGTADFNPGAGTANLTSAGFGDIFISFIPADYKLFLPLLLR
jgi:hypothetical protein